MNTVYVLMKCMMMSKIAAPIKDYTGKAIASVSTVGPREQIKEELIPNYVKELVKTGKEISSKLGHIESLQFKGEGCIYG